MDVRQCGFCVGVIGKFSQQKTPLDLLKIYACIDDIVIFLRHENTFKFDCIYLT